MRKIILIFCRPIFFPIKINISMEIIPKQISFHKNVNQKITYYVEDDQIRFLFIVILLLGIILLISRTPGAYIFLIVGLCLVAFICLFKPQYEKTPSNLIETFTCQALDLTYLTHDIGITTIPEDSISHRESRRRFVHSPGSEEQNCQIKFRNSIRIKK